MRDRDSITATELAKLGNCQLRLVHEWGYTGIAKGEKPATVEEARKRGIRIHSESESRVENVYAIGQQRTIRYWLLQTVKAMLVAGVAVIAFMNV